MNNTWAVFSMTFIIVLVLIYISRYAGYRYSIRSRRKKK